MVRRAGRQLNWETIGQSTALWMALMILERHQSFLKYQESDRGFGFLFYYREAITTIKGEGTGSGDEIHKGNVKYNRERT
jgi:hypothetical protein